MGKTAAARSGGVLLAGVVLVVLAAVMLTLVLVRAGAVEGEPVLHPPVPPPPPPPAVLPAASGGAPLTAEQVQAAIADPVAGAAALGTVAVSVRDLATGEELYDHRANAAMIPASTIKLVTAVTALAARGPAYQIPTTAVAGSEPGEVVLVGGGDPTLALGEVSFYPGAARLDRLASQVLSALGDTPVTRVTVDSRRFTGDVYGPWTSDIPTGGYVGPITALMSDGGRIDPDPAQGASPSARYDEPDLAVGEHFAALLGLGDDAVVERGAAPDGAAVLGEVYSPPMVRLVDIMLTDSDNVIAEALARQVALARGEPASFEGAAKAMAEVLVELGLATPEQQPELADGSGLSRDNQISARLLTDLLILAAGPGPAELSGLFAGLPVAGWSGTLLDRHDRPPPELALAEGVVRAKTGSLFAVDALAGVVETAGGRWLAFAVIANDVSVDHDTAREALDRIPAALAGP
ncbi:MAG TPA: D-alanyl-D-alanine carboxypeptidase/D-alanyl-D-alanine-endopeptidase [Natronosporangium sp.]|nr:D-alanyl-D-alanine carboxypeptidase/D-alanyl-D-alanine-endopeptidase [Natronosporangium sp.]